MKSGFYALTLTVLFLSSFASADTPLIRTTVADSSNVSLIATAPLSWQTVENDSLRYIRFTDSPLTDSVGYPELPMIICLVAVPDSVNPTIEYSFGLETEQSVLPVYPAPAQILVSENCTASIADSFAMDSTAYASATFWPAKRVRLIGETRICDQRLLKIQLFPAQYRAADSTLSTVTSFSVSVSWDSTETVWSTIGLGEFQRFTENSPIAGYHYTEQSHAPVPDYFGVVDPYDGPAYPNNRMPEYIIICASGLYDECENAIDSLAEHRVSLNHFDVATVLTDSILAEFGVNGQTAIADSTIKDFTEHMWESWPGASTNHPSYLLLIGDHEDTSCASEDWFLPTHEYSASGSGGTITDIGNDEWYVYFNGNRSIQNDFPDMMVGRLSVRNGGTQQTDTLSTLIQNFISLESPIQSAPLVDNRRKILRFAGTGQDYSGDTGLQTYYSWEPDRSWTADFTDWLGYNYTTYYGGDCRNFTMSDSSLMSSDDFMGACIDELKTGAGVAFYTNHGELHLLSAGLDWSEEYYPYQTDFTKGALDSTFNNIQIENQLTSTNQYYSAPFILMLCCSAGTFNHTYAAHSDRHLDRYFCLWNTQGYDYDFGVDCIAEKLLKNTDVPVAGVFASSQPSDIGHYSSYGSGILEAIYARGHGRLGDAIASARMEYINDFISYDGYFSRSISQYNLLGDPALDISDRVRYPNKCDLEIYTDDIYISQYPSETASGINLPITITIQNNGRQESDEYDVKVTVTHGTSINVSYINDCDGIQCGESAVLEHAYTPSSLSMPLNVTVKVEVDYNEDCEDSWRGNNEAEATVQLVDTYPTESGWPIEVTGGITTTPILTNLDADSSLEIVCLTGTSLTAFETDGTELWRLMSEGFSDAAHPLAADLDADGHSEIVLYCVDTDIKVVSYDGVVIDSLENASDVFAVGNLSSNTGLELCVAYGNTIGLYGLSNGSITALDTKNFGYQYTRNPKSLLCANLGGSHTYMDIAYLSGTHASDPGPPPGTGIEVYNWSTSRTLYSNTWNEFAVTVALSAGSLSGIESVGYPGKAYSDSTDIPAQLIEPGEQTGEVDCDDQDMLPVSNLLCGVITDWTATTGNDIYVLPSERQCMAWEVDGESFSGFPTAEFSGASQGNSVSPVTLGNLDGTGYAEVVFNTELNDACAVDAINSSGNELASLGFPFVFPDGVSTYGGFSVADLDRDGNVEVVFGTNDGLLHCWEFGSCTTGYAPWPMYQHDCGRSGAL
ncbi:MAG: hypothetical protein J7K88_10480 [Candidatus Fermentibacteraceae bacterium]|nr:hypothetical protein [Candidatus Fermentibacteraceae bacterium]